jgi:hypothetical protein
MALVSSPATFDTVNDLATAGANNFVIRNAGNDLLSIGAEGSVGTGRLTLADSGILDPFSKVKISGTMNVLNTTPQGTGFVDIAATLNMVGSIRAAAAFSGKATVTGSAALPFISGMLYEVEQQSTGTWGNNQGSWQQQPVVVGARWSARTGSINMGSYGSVFTAFPPDFDFGTGFSATSGVYVGFDARPGQSNVKILKGMNISPQINTAGEAFGLEIGKSSGSVSSFGLSLLGDGLGADIVFGLLHSSNMYDSGTDLVFDADRLAAGGRSFIFQNGPLNISALDLITDTTTGTKIGTAVGQKLGFWNAAPIVQPTVTGSRAGNAALASLLTQLATMGLVVDTTTA